MPKPKRNEFPDFSGKADAMQQMFRKLPRIVGRIAVNFYKDSFRRGGFIDERYERWPQRKVKDKRSGRRALLVKSGRLRRSIRIVNTTTRSVTVGTDVPYAEIHNTGGTISGSTRVRAHKRKAHKRRYKGRTVRVPETTVKSHSRNFSHTIPQRKFIGRSRLLEKRIMKLVQKNVENILS